MKEHFNSVSCLLLTGNLAVDQVEVEAVLTTDVVETTKLRRERSYK